MQCLFFGSRGWIGKVLSDMFRSGGFAVIDATSRADDVSAVTQELDLYVPTHVVCCIGRTHGPEYPTIDYLELPGKLYENIRDNLFSPLALAILCRERGIHLTYLGTGCIFSDKNLVESNTTSREYGESDTPDFFGSQYSTVKGFTDRLQHLFPNVLNVRIRMPISSDMSPRNFIVKITKYAKICSIPNSMSVLDDLLPLLVRFASEKRTGTINLTNPGCISHAQILDMYREIIDPEFTYSLFSYDEQAQVIKCARSNNVLCTRKLQEWAPDVPDIFESVRTTLLRMREHAFENIVSTA